MKAERKPGLLVMLALTVLVSSPAPASPWPQTDTGVEFEDRPAPMPLQLSPLTPQIRAQIERGYRAYIECFNRQDLACFANYFNPDVVFFDPKWVITSRGELIAFYRKNWRYLTEHLTVKSIRIEGDHLFVDVPNDLHVFADYPDFPAGHLHKGENLHLTGVVVYTLKDGRFSRVED